MIPMKSRVSLLVLAALIPSAAFAATPDWKQQFTQLSEDYFNQVYFRYSPTAGTLAGFHQYDAQLEDFSRKSIDAEIARAPQLRAPHRGHQTRCVQR